MDCDVPGGTAIQPVNRQHQARVRKQDAKGARQKKHLNLALQGGGAHGAFTWGVIDGLLADGRIRFDSVSGTSAGAINAVLLAAGLLEGGPAGARSKLEFFWREISHSAPPRMMSGLAFDVMSQFLSPYQFNPLDLNPLRGRLDALVDFDALRRRSPLHLFIAATEVQSGNRRVFKTSELTVEAVLASACLPRLQQAVRIGDSHYWDGGYAANPVLLPLVRQAKCEDTLLVQLIPLNSREVPTRSRDISERLNGLAFTSALRSEIELIELGRLLAGDGLVIGGRLHRRFRRHRFHHIDATPDLHDLPPDTRLNPERRLIIELRESGRRAAASWLGTHFDALGRRDTAKFSDNF